MSRNRRGRGGGEQAKGEGKAARPSKGTGKSTVSKTIEKPKDNGQNNAEKVLKKRQTGQVVQWKGNFGWIEPSQPIDHPAAGKSRGRVYLPHEQVEEDITGVGANVSFFVWADEKGLSARNVRPDTGGGGNGKGGGKAQEGSSGKGGGKANGKGGAATQNGSQRQKIGGGRMTGTVQDWRGTFGWIMPLSKIDHPDAGKKGGKIYFGQEDVQSELSGVGATVSFLLYKDKNGLGAAQVQPSKGGQNSIMPAGQGKKQQGGKGQGKQQESKAQVKNTKLKAKKEQVKKEPKERGPIDKSKRTLVSDTSVGGVVIRALHGRLAFIKPDEDIDHPKFNETKQVFLHKDDVEGDEFPKAGATVLFSVYEDEGHNLGAESCQVLEQGDGTLPEHLKGERNRNRNRKDRKSRGKKKDKEAKATTNVKVGAFAKKQAENKKKKNKKNRKKDKGGEGGEKKEKGPSGPDLPRERISDSLVTGEVLMMGRTFGWVKPTDAVAHEMAQKHGGKIYMHKKDIAEGAKLEKGSTVTFHVYVDSSGLGAEQCS